MSRPVWKQTLRQAALGDAGTKSDRALFRVGAIDGNGEQRWEVLKVRTITSKLSRNNNNQGMWRLRPAVGTPVLWEGPAALTWTMTSGQWNHSGEWYERMWWLWWLHFSTFQIPRRCKKDKTTPRPPLKKPIWITLTVNIISLHNKVSNTWKKGFYFRFERVWYLVFFKQQKGLVVIRTSQSCNNPTKLMRREAV